VDEPPVVAVDPDLLLPTASVAKVFLLVELGVRVESGAVDLATPLTRTGHIRVADSGLWQHLVSDTLAVGDVAVLVGRASDNWGTNALLELVGLEAVQERAASLAPGGSTLLDRVRDHRGPDDPPTLSTGCASDWVGVLAGLHAGAVVSRDVSARVLGWLRGGLDLSMVAGAFGLDPLAHDEPDREVEVWSKTGTADGVRADVGLVAGPRATWTYAALCEWDPAGADRRDDVLAAMRELGARVRAAVA
jgi:beta-lactamase class A